MPKTEPAHLLTTDLPSDLRDLYDAPPAPSTALGPDNDPVVGLLRDVGRDFAVLVGLFAVSLTAFVACVTLVSLGAGLAVLVVGLFVLLAGLVVAGWSARMSRLLLGAAGVELPATRYPLAAPVGRGRLRRLGHVQSWRDLLYVLVTFPISVFSFSVAVSWVAGGLGGLTYWFWSRWLPADNHGLPELLGVPVGWPTSLSTPWSGWCCWPRRPSCCGGSSGCTPPSRTHWWSTSPPRCASRSTT